MRFSRANMLLASLHLDPSQAFMDHATIYFSTTDLVCRDQPPAFPPFSTTKISPAVQVGFDLRIRFNWNGPRAELISTLIPDFTELIAPEITFQPGLRAGNRLAKV